MFWTPFASTSSAPSFSISSHRYFWEFLSFYFPKWAILYHNFEVFHHPLIFLSDLIDLSHTLFMVLSTLFSVTGHLQLLNKAEITATQSLSLTSRTLLTRYRFDSSFFAILISRPVYLENWSRISCIFYSIFDIFCYTLPYWRCTRR